MFTAFLNSLFILTIRKKFHKVFLELFTCHIFFDIKRLEARFFPIKVFLVSRSILLKYAEKTRKNAHLTNASLDQQLCRLKVKDLLHAVGKKCGVDSTIIDALDLENVVERTIAIKVRQAELVT